MDDEPTWDRWDGDRLKAQISRKVQHLVSVPEGRSKVFRVAWGVAGLIVVVAGVAMTVFPGPAIIVIPIGLAMLAGVFAWARGLLDRSIDRGVDMERWVAELDLRVKVLAALAGIGLVAALVAVYIL